MRHFRVNGRPIRHIFRHFENVAASCERSLNCQNYLDQSGVTIVVHNFLYLSGKPRGYMVLRKQEGRLPLLLFRISSALAVTQGERVKDRVKECIRQWDNWLTEKRTGFSDMIESADLLTEVIAHLLEILSSLPGKFCDNFGKGFSYDCVFIFNSIASLLLLLFL